MCNDFNNNDDNTNMHFEFVMRRSNNGECVRHYFTMPDSATHLDITERYMSFLRGVGYCFSVGDTLQVVDKDGNVKDFFV